MATSKKYNLIWLNQPYYIWLHQWTSSVRVRSDRNSSLVTYFHFYSILLKDGCDFLTSWWCGSSYFMSHEKKNGKIGNADGLGGKQHLCKSRLSNSKSLSTQKDIFNLSIVSIFSPCYCLWSAHAQRECFSLTQQSDLRMHTWGKITQ